VLKGEKADWETARKVLAEANFMKSLFDYDKDNISEAVMKRLQKYLDNPDFTPEAVAKQSKAAQSLCMWARAMEVYYRVSKVSLGYRSAKGPQIYSSGVPCIYIPLSVPLSLPLRSLSPFLLVFPLSFFVPLTPSF
jgi:Microtubule-binding stalk of dynein motor